MIDTTQEYVELKPDGNWSEVQENLEKEFAAGASEDFSVQKSE